MRFLYFSFTKSFRKNALRLQQLCGNVRFSLLPRRRQIEKNWNLASFRMYGLASPWRPSREDIAIYRRHIAVYADRPSRAIILGATPELRDLLAENKIHYIVADQSWNMIVAMGRLLKRAETKKEAWLKTDWRDLQFPPHYFDLILGDLVLWQFMSKEQDEFLRTISSLISRDGIFITRIHVTNPNLRSQKPSSIISACLSLHCQSDREIMGLLVARLFDCLSDATNQKTNNAAVMAALYAYSPRTEREKSIIRATLRGWDSLFLDYASQSEDEIRNTFNKYFLVLSQQKSAGYEDAAWYPIIVASPIPEKLP